MSLLERINTLLDIEFGSLEDLLVFYKEELPKRAVGYHQDEVGPIMHHDRPGEADKFVRKIFTLGERTVDMSAGLDWYAAAEGDLEWNGGLVRQGYFMLLASAYERTGDEKYAATIIEHMLDYLRRVPPFQPEGKPYLEYKKSTWRPFEAAGRAAETWPEALAKIIKSPNMTPETWAEILLSSHEHGVFLREHHWRTGNHACLETAALGLLGCFYQEFKEAEAWRAYALDFLMRMWPEQFHADGYTKEMSGGYHWVAIRSFFTYYEVACKNGFTGLFPPEYRERLILASYAELYQDKPDFGIPITNDSNTKTNRCEQLIRVNRLFALPEIEYVLSGGKSGQAPEKTSVFFPSARVGIMRSDWGKDARYLFCDLGRWGENHMNEDQLHVEVSAYGRKFLVGCGRWRYTTSPDAPWMPWAKYFKTTAAYNSILVDGYSQIPGDAEGGMVVREDYDYAEGVFAAGYGEDAGPADERLLKERGLTTGKVCRVTGVTHRRQIIFVKPHFWVLRDIVTGPGAHEAEQLWHYYDGVVAPDASGRFMVTGFPDANLILTSLGDNPVAPRVWLGSENPIRGWHCPYYDQKRPAPELSFRQQGQDRIVFHTLILPVQGKPAAMPEFTVLTDGYAVAFAGRTWRVEAPSEGEWRLAHARG